MFDFFLLAVQVVEVEGCPIDLAISISVLGEGLYAKIEPSEVYSNVGFVQNTMYIHNCVLCIFRTIIINPMYYSPSLLLGV